MISDKFSAWRMNRGTKQGKTLHIQKLALNILSIHTKNGLYVLAYRNLNLDVKNKAFKPDEDITICTQFTIGGEQENIRRYLDADEYELLSDFEKNLEKIKDAIQKKTVHGQLWMTCPMSSDLAWTVH